MEVPNHGSVVITPAPVTFRAGPIDFYLTAKAHCDAADLLREHSPPPLRVLGSFYCQSVELALKAYLLARGNTLRQVEGRRHDLRRLLIDSFALGIDTIVDITPAEREQLIALSERYERARLTYLQKISDLWLFGWQRPDFELLSAVARKLVVGIEKGCLDASTGEWRPFAPRSGQ